MEAAPQTSSGGDKMIPLQLNGILKNLNDEESPNKKICFIGDNKIFSILSVIGSKNPRLKDSEFKNLTEVSPEIKSCSIIYISSKIGAQKIKSVMSVIASSSNFVVSISEIPDFINSYNGTIHLYVEENSPKFSVNVKSANAKGYKISSKLIEIADETF